VPRTEFVSAPEHEKADVQFLDLSLLSADEDFQIDTGVTSGADSSDWDPINIDEDKAEEECGGAGSASAATKGSPAACGVKQKQ
jgi:hypothetical protein